MPAQNPTVAEPAPEATPEELALVRAVQALEPFASIGAAMALGRDLPDHAPAFGSDGPASRLNRGMMKDAFRAHRALVRLLEGRGLAPDRMPTDRTAPAAMIAAVAACVAEARDRIEEAELSLVAAREIAGPDGWRDLYAAYWDTVHPQPPPMEPGVLQAGDRVVQFGADGLVHGPATVMAIVRVEGFPGSFTTFVEYLYDKPAVGPDGKTRAGATVAGRALLHLRDWPLGFLGFDAAEYEMLPGHVPGYVPQTPGFFGA